MKRLILYGWMVLLGACTPPNQDTAEDTVPYTSETGLQVFELRTYYAAEGKLEDLLSRFREHTVSLFEKHGMTNVAYWVPVDNTTNTLTYLLGYTSRAQRDSSWNHFRNDPDWQAVFQASRVDGPLIDSVRSIFMTRTDFSPELEIVNRGPRVFEMRTYFTHPGKLPELHARFSDHTMSLFEKNGMTNVAYFDLMDDQPEAGNTLLYFLSHPDTASASNNWRAFLADPEWQEVYQKSVQNGYLVKTLNSVYLRPVDFSPIK